MEQKSVFHEEWVYNPEVEALSYFYEGRDIYAIDIERIVGSAGILDWIMQVAAKRWATAQCLKALIEALDYLGDDLQKNFCSCGKDNPQTRMIDIVRRREIGWRYFPMPKTKAKGDQKSFQLLLFGDLVERMKKDEEVWADESFERARKAGLVQDDPARSE